MVSGDVQVFSLVAPPKGTAKERRRWKVKWRVVGRDKTRSFKTKVEAERLRTALQLAAIDGEAFDLTTGLPLSWTRPTATWWTWSVEWFAPKWRRWSGNSRRTAAETLVSLTPHLVRHGAPDPPEQLGIWLRNVGYTAPRIVSPEDEPYDEWLRRWSVPLDAMPPGLIEATLDAVSLRKDGKPVSPAVIRRRRNSLKSVLSAAVRRGLIDANPMDRVEWKVPQRSIALDVSRVASVIDVDEVVEYVWTLPRGGSRYAALFAVVGLAGVRPSEPAALRLEDLELPESGWGLARLRGAVTSPGKRYTSDGSKRETKGLKHRPADDVREVPLPPDLVERLRLHLDRFPPVDGRVFSNHGDEAVAADNYGPVWTRARKALWPGDHPNATLRVYDLRHAAATTMLRSKVMPAEVARRLGHSVDVLHRIYAGRPRRRTRPLQRPHRGPARRTAPATTVSSWPAVAGGRPVRPRRSGDLPSNDFSSVRPTVHLRSSRSRCTGRCARAPMIGPTGRRGRTSSGSTRRPSPTDSGTQTRARGTGRSRAGCRWARACVVLL